MPEMTKYGMVWRCQDCGMVKTVRKRRPAWDGYCKQCHRQRRWLPYRPNPSPQGEKHE